VAGVNDQDTSGNRQSKVLSRYPRPWFNSAYPQPLTTYSVG